MIFFLLMFMNKFKFFNCMRVGEAILKRGISVQYIEKGYAIIEKKGGL